MPRKETGDLVLREYNRFDKGEWNHPAAPTTGSLKERNEDQRAAKTFGSLMMKSKVRAALHLVSDQVSVGVLDLEDEIDSKEVQHILKEKQPPAKAAHSATLLAGVDNTTETHTVLFERIDGDLIRSTALKGRGSAGPSGMDAAWSHMCTAFHGASRDLCNSLAAFTHCICSNFINSSGFVAFIAYRLIPLDKKPGRDQLEFAKLCDDW